jgi:hypothetical protein
MHDSSTFFVPSNNQLIAVRSFLPFDICQFKSESDLYTPSIMFFMQIVMDGGLVSVIVSCVLFGER